MPARNESAAQIAASPVRASDGAGALPAAAPPGGRGKLRAWLVLGAWLVLAAVCLPFAMQLSGATTDSATDYLPASAPSTTVAVVEQQLPGGDQQGVTVVYQRPSGVTPADRADVQRVATELGGRFAAAASAPQVRLSPDGKALAFSLPIAPGHGEPGEFVPQIRALVQQQQPDGLQAYVTGQSALDADLDAAFDGIDLKLLLVTVAVVTVLLLLIYRSPTLWLVPLLAVGLATLLSMAAAYALVRLFDVTVNQQTSAVLTILAFGIGTDYALLIVSRYRQELGMHAAPARAMVLALRRTTAALLTSGLTVTAGLLCLLFADMNNTSGMAVVGAVAVLCTMLAMLTFFPAVLVLLGRGVFWPRIPRLGEHRSDAGRLWPRIAGWVNAHRLRSVLGSLAVLAALAVGTLVSTTAPLNPGQDFVTQPPAVAGMTVLSERFAGAGGQAATVLAPTARRDQVRRAIEAVPGVDRVETGRSTAQWTEFAAFPAAPPGSAAEARTIGDLRTAAATASPDALVGGRAAESIDVATASARDRWVVIPLILVVVTLTLMLLVRSVLVAIGLTLTVVASFAAAFGAGVWISDHLLGFAGLDPALLLLSFMFLVALGIDYNIFLIHRVRSEAVGHGIGQGIIRGLIATGGVITSAGVVLAATFATLTTLPLVSMVQLGVVVSIGVLLDTVLVRSVLVPALGLLAGDRGWAGLSRIRRSRPQGQPPARSSTSVDTAGQA